MKQIRMMYLNNCPHCHRAFSMIEELKREYPIFKDLQMECIEEREQPEIADSLDYYYVPTFYVEGVKLHEGVPTKEKLLTVLKAAL